MSLPSLNLALTIKIVSPSFSNMKRSLMPLPENSTPNFFLISGRMERASRRSAAFSKLSFSEASSSIFLIISLSSFHFFPLRISMT